ncbi:hypothetical protein GCM10010404_10120 [Nonomuraea africana]
MPHNPHVSDSDPAVIELYKIAVEMADRVSSRRAVANAFFLSIQTTLISVSALSLLNVQRAWPMSLVLAVVGVALSATWWFQLRSYRDLNRAKFTVINEIELRLPVQPFTSEWKSLVQTRTNSWWRRYADLGASERFIPGVFAVLHLLTFAGRFTT